jgi:hypothetical protein
LISIGVRRPCQPLLGFAQLAQQPMQRVGALQLAQARGVGRRDVDRDVAGRRVDALEAIEVVLEGALVGRVLVLADVDSEHAPIAAALDIGQQGIDPGIVEAHAVDDGRVPAQAKHARLRIALLRARGGGSDLKKSETQRPQGIDVGAVLIQSRGQAHRVGKLDVPKRLRHRPAALGDQGIQPQSIGRRQPGQSEVVRPLGIHQHEQGSNEAIHAGSWPGWGRLEVFGAHARPALRGAQVRERVAGGTPPGRRSAGAGPRSPQRGPHHFPK